MDGTGRIAARLRCKKRGGREGYFGLTGSPRGDAPVRDMSGFAVAQTAGSHLHPHQRYQETEPGLILSSFMSLLVSMGYLGPYVPLTASANQ